MDASTQQFVSKLFAAVLALVVVGIAGALIAAIFHFGDGEAQHIIGDLTAPFLGLLGAFAAIYTGHTVATAITASQVVKANAQATAQVVIPAGYVLIPAQSAQNTTVAPVGTVESLHDGR